MATITTRRRFALGAPLLAAAAPPLAPALAQTAAAEWPSRPVRFILPYPPGGPTDIMGRVVAQALTRDLPQPIVVENRAGAAGAIGTEAVARAAPDGTTFLVNASAHVIVPHMVRVPYDALGDFAPVTNIASVPLMLVVTPGLPVRSVAELIAHARRTPASSPSPRRRTAARRTWRASCSSSWPASTWRTCPTAAAGRRCRT